MALTKTIVEEIVDLKTAIASKTTYKSGTYTPTITNSSNIGTSAHQASHYQEVGNVLKVWNLVQVDAITANVVANIAITLPPGYTLSNQANAMWGGVIAGAEGWQGHAWRHSTLTNNILYQWVPTISTNANVWFHVMIWTGTEGP